MKRFLTIISATAVAAAVTIPAVADSESPSDRTATVETCLRAHGIPIPAGLEGVAVKEWTGAHPNTPGLKDAFKACDPEEPKQSGPAPQELRACLASKGLNPPSSLDEFKPWVLQQSHTTAGKDALNACGFEEKKRVIGDGGACGTGKSPAETSRAQRPQARTTPTT